VCERAWRARVEVIEKADQVKAVAGLGGHAEDVAVVDLLRGKQALRAVARVLVLAASLIGASREVRSSIPSLLASA